MILKCIHNNYKQIPVLMVYYGFLPSCNLALTIGKLYAVYAITFGGFPYHGNQNASLYLIVDDNRYYGFFPTLLFETVCLHLHGDGWCFGELSGNYVPHSIIGYERLIKDPLYFEQLVRRDWDAHKIFEDWKISIDESMNNATCPCNVHIDHTSILHPSYTKEYHK
jgi:hypothetical protein